MAMSVIKSYRKAVPERRRLYLDYSCWLEDVEKLTGFQATITPWTEGFPLTMDIAYSDSSNQKLSVFVGGGVANTNYTVRMTVTTDSGQIKADDIGIAVTP
jgi:hypothetical protein